jgi:ClpP class serine protease
MEGEGTAVVFAGVLTEVKRDMEAVQTRLNNTRVGADTQQIEQDVIDQLTMMKEALKKARQELENKQNDPKPNDPNAQQQKPRLLELLNELKLVRAQQDQLNKRTIMYNKQDPGEQARDPLVQGELKTLSDRQRVLQDMLHKIATQANQ